MPRNIGNLLNMVDVSRVEVLRGPQGTLFGKNTIGGALNITSNSPDPEMSGEADLTGGGLDDRALKGYVNVPLSDTVYARVSIAGEQAGRICEAAIGWRHVGKQKLHDRPRNRAMAAEQ